MIKTRSTNGKPSTYNALAKSSYHSLVVTVLTSTCPTRMRNDNRKAFTLVELLVAIAIVAVLAALLLLLH